jgi:hypothetical protein
MNTQATSLSPSKAIDRSADPTTHDESRFRKALQALRESPTATDRELADRLEEMVYGGDLQVEVETVLMEIATKTIAERAGGVHGSE